MCESSDENSGQAVGYFYAWWRGDPLPELKPLTGYACSATSDRTLLDSLSDLTWEEVDERIKQGNQPYIACLQDEPVAYGWSAREQAEIGELSLTFRMPPGNRYLWDFVTLPNWRGRGIYPRMIRDIIRAELGDAERFWIGHDLDNIASARGIEKAGVHPIGEVHIRDGQPVFVGGGPRDRARAAAELLGLPLSDEPD